MRHRTAMALRPASKTRIAFFWATVIAIPLSSAFVIAVLSRTLPHGGLAKVSIVFSLSLIGTVLPIGAQAKAAADAAANGSAGHVGWRPIWVLTGVGLVLSVPVAFVLRVPALAVLCPVASLVPALAVGVGRGELIGQGNFGEVSFNNSIEVTLRLVAGIVLGLAFKADGVAVSTLVYTLGAWLFLPTRLPTDTRIRLQGALTASTLLIMSVQADLLLAPRLLGANSDKYATAALPAKGVYLALAAAAWLVVGSALTQRRYRDAIRPVVLVIGAGIGLSVPMALAAPLIGKLLGRPTPNKALLFVLGLSMALSAGNWVLLQLRLARHAATLWIPPALAILLVAIIGGAHMTEAGLAAGMLVGQAVALFVGLLGLAYDIRTTEPPTETPVALLAGFGELTAESVAEHVERAVAAIAPPTATAAAATAVHAPPPPKPAAPPAVRREPDASPSKPRTSRPLLWLVSALITLEVMLQYSGKLVHDTRLDVALQPVTFLENTWHLWQGFADMGRIQNQAVGYLFPMGPFFVLGHMLQIPTWVIQRSWISMLLVVALWGAAKLADELEIGTPLARLVGAAAFALSPFFIDRIGMISGFVMAAAFLPWTLIPLVRGSRGGSVRRAAAYSGLAVLFMGGINGAVTLAVLAMPAIFLLTRERGPRRAQLMRWWVVSVGLACAWWILPLSFQGAYGVNFLSFTEKADVTTSYTPIFEVLRGTADWLSFFHLHGPYIPAGYTLAYTAAAIAASAAVAAIGIYGLSKRDMPERAFIALTFLLGVLCVGAGFGATFKNPQAPLVQHALDGILAPFRTVYKFEPLIALPLALGVIHGITALTRYAQRTVARYEPSTTWRDVVRYLPAVGAVVLILVGALPLLTDNLLNNEPFDQVPTWWTQAENYIQQAPGRTLLLPGLPLSYSSWGFTAEEPLQWGTTKPWATRSIAPLGSPAATQYLDTIESTVEQGGNTALPDYLRRGGFSTVLVRNDGDYRKWNAPDPITVNSALLASGLKPVASFGPEVPQPTQAGVPSLKLKQIVIYSVGDVGPVTSYPLSTAAVVSGGSESPLTLAQLGLSNRAMILAADYQKGDPLPPYWIVTDGNRRRYVFFGLNRDNESYVVTADEPGPDDAPMKGGQYPGTSVKNQTVAIRTGIKGITASSSGSWIASIPEVGPGQAIDGDSSTAWASGPNNDTSNGQWIEVELDKPLAVDHISVQLLEDGPWRPAVHALRITTDRGSVLDKVKPDQSVQQVRVPRGTTGKIRITFEQTVDQALPTAGAGIREITIPGVKVDERLLAPSELTSQFSSSSTALPIYVFQRSTANPHSLLRKDEENSINRQFVVPRAGTFATTGTASAEPGTALLNLLDDVPGRFSISASSTAGDLPEYAPRNLVDQNPLSIWVASTTSADDLGIDASSQNGVSAAPSVLDRKPKISMSWNQNRTLNSILVGGARGYSTPAQVTLTSGKSTRVVNIDAKGVGNFAPLTVSHVDITFTRIARYVVTDSTGISQVVRPVALSELRFPALDDLTPKSITPSDPVHVSCSDGPSLKVGSTTIHYAIDTTYGTLVSLDPTTVKACNGVQVPLPAGSADLDSTMGSSPFNLDTVQLADPAVVAASAAGSSAARKVEPVKWTDDSRTVRIAPGSAAYFVVNENANKGWQATLDGKTLRPITLDGWRQGYIVPAGAGGLIHLTYKPTVAYQGSLIIGLLLVLVLFALCLIPVRSRVRMPAPLVEGTIPRWLTIGAVGVAAVVIGGFAVVLVVPLYFVRRARSRWLAAIAGAAYAAGGLWVALSQQQAPSLVVGSFSYPANVLALVAFLAFGLTMLPDDWPQKRRPALDPSFTSGEPLDVDEPPRERVTVGAGSPR